MSNKSPYKSIKELYCDYPDLEIINHKGRDYYHVPGPDYLIGALRYKTTIIKMFNLTAQIMEKYFPIPYKYVKNQNYSSGPMASLYRESEIRYQLENNKELQEELSKLYAKKKKTESICRDKLGLVH